MLYLLLRKEFWILTNPPAGEDESTDSLKSEKESPIIILSWVRNKWGTFNSVRRLEINIIG